MEPLDEIDFTNEVFIENECSFCEDGLQPNIKSKDFVDTVFDVQIQITQVLASFNVPIDDETFNPTIQKVGVVACEPGYGIAAGSTVFDCVECPFNQFSLRPDIGACIDCESVQEGLECQGGNHTILTFNWWVAVLDENDDELKDFYFIQWYDNVASRRRLQGGDSIGTTMMADEVEGPLIDDTIITALCPPKFCCQLVGGCDYLSEYLSNTTNGTGAGGLCAEGRDVSGKFSICVRFFRKFPT